MNDRPPSLDLPLEEQNEWIMGQPIDTSDTFPCSVGLSAPHSVPVLERRSRSLASTPTTDTIPASLSTSSIPHHRPSASMTNKRKARADRTASNPFEELHHKFASVEAAAFEKEIPLPKFVWPQDPSDLTEQLLFQFIDILRVCGSDPVMLRRRITFSTLSRLLRQTEKCLATSPNVLGLRLEKECTLTILGDTHGQFYDVLHVLERVGYPSSTNWLVVNGDWVDRGSWGVELTCLLFALKLMYPQSVHLLRGNHETVYCTKVYGFLEECKHKYSKAMYGKFQSCFARIPLAAVILPHTSPPVPGLTSPLSEGFEIQAHGIGLFVVHGGLFRDIDQSVGTLRLLQSIKRYVKDPDCEPLLDVLWSDPAAQQEMGLKENQLRGCATLFGPDITEAFLDDHGLHQMLRSHEGCDAREKRPWLSNTMRSGFGVDQFTSDGKPMLLTLFSAPNYIQRGNQGAYAQIQGTSDTLEIDITHFEAVPHPKVQTYYAEDTGLTDMSQSEED